MLPSFTRNNVAYGSFANAPFSCQGAMANASTCIYVADLSDLFLRQLGIVTGVIFAMRQSTFFGRITKIMGGFSQKQMPRVDAGRIVATVADAHLQREGTVGNSVGNARGAYRLVGEYTTIGSRKRMKYAITSCATASSPRPAFVGTSDADLQPEPKDVLRSEGRDDTVWSSHSNLLYRLLWSGRFAGHSVSRPLLRHDTRKAA